MKVAGLSVVSLSGPFGTRLQLEIPVDVVERMKGADAVNVPEAVEKLDPREVEQLRDICNAFLDGESVR
jgi:hypothetical protein